MESEHDRLMRNIEVMDEDMARVLRSKSGVERLQIASAMFASARKMIIAQLTKQHPDWTQEEILRETARRISHGAV